MWEGAHPPIIFWLAIKGYHLFRKLAGDILFFGDSCGASGKWDKNADISSITEVALIF